MVVLIDTNVIIDFLLKRESYSEPATVILQKCAKKELIGYLAFHSIPNIWYILRKVPDKNRREWLMDLCSFLHVTGASHEEVVKAIANVKFVDFEDCLQDRCAKIKGAQYIITRNEKDFVASEVPAVSPQAFLDILKNIK